ncbi:MAG: MATE family efflux transporter [Ruminococcaceae bacterium]|nr:MATE family efflux transporter [Oscillospiraceae bacterium]
MSNRKLRGYLFPNMLAMLGISLYIIVDTYFISAYAGTNGITALNLIIPVFSVIFAIGGMLGNGAATAYSLEKATPNGKAEDYFSVAVITDLIISIPLVFIGAVYPKEALGLLGADELITQVGCSYISTVLICTPLYLINSSCTAFVRNDGAPNIAMAATLASSFFNVVFDYVFIFLFDWGMFGAALATGISPLISILVMLWHFLSKRNTIRLRLILPKIKMVVRSCRLGVGYFIGEIAGGVTGFVFNTILLRISGNVAVAAYGIVCNVAVIGTAVFSGVAQGLQPMASEAQGSGDVAGRKAICRYAIKVAVWIAVGIVSGLVVFAPQVVTLFNSEKDMAMEALAIPNLQLYVIGFLPASVNIALCGYLGAVGRDRLCGILSVCRGVVAIIFFAVVLSHLFGILGVWIAYPVTEFFTLMVALLTIKKRGI